MRKRTIKSGLNLILAGIVSLILATFCHEHIARLFFLSPDSETIFIYLGFFSGGMFGCIGILATVAGLVRSSGERPAVSLSYTLILLAAAFIIYFFLLYSSFTSSEPPKLRPGETITI
ncbi:MAG: hypothetical protein ABSG48_03985 [Geobacteraceae bacterium]